MRSAYRARRADGQSDRLTGISPHGQGEETSFAQIVGDMLGVSIDDVLVIHGDTDRAIRHRTSAAAASRWAGPRWPSPRKVVAKARTLAAHLLGTNEASLTFENGRFVGAPDDRSVTIQEVALAAYVLHNIPPDFEPGLVATHFFEPKNFTFPNGTHVCVVEVDKEIRRREDSALRRRRRLR